MPRTSKLVAEPMETNWEKAGERAAQVIEHRSADLHVRLQVTLQFHVGSIANALRSAHSPTAGAIGTLMHLAVPYISTRRFRNNLGAFGMTAALGFFSVGGLATRCAPAPPPIEQVADVQLPVVASANEYRAQSGLGALSVDQRLTNTAQSHANDMAARSVMTHTGAGGTTVGQRINAAGYGWTTCAENVAAGQTTPGEVMGDWMNSRGHAANILNGNMGNIGVAAAVGANGVTYWAMVLAA